MSKRKYLVCLVALAGLTTLPALAQQADKNDSESSDGCRQAIESYARATHDYLAAKFALDRATQLLASARYSSMVGMMKIDMAIRESDVASAIPKYIAAIAPAYAAISVLKTACPTNAITVAHQLPNEAKLKNRLDEDLTLFLERGIDRLADDQMTDIKTMFDNMKARQR